MIVASAMNDAPRVEGIWPAGRPGAYPDAIGSRLRRGVLAPGEQARGLAAVGRTELAPGAVEVAVDGPFGELQLAGDLLGSQVLADEAQALALTRR
jgi:hypothetical protein